MPADQPKPDLKLLQLQHDLDRIGNRVRSLEQCCQSNDAGQRLLKEQMRQYSQLADQVNQLKESLTEHRNVNFDNWAKAGLLIHSVDEQFTQKLEALQNTVGGTKDELHEFGKTCDGLGKSVEELRAKITNAVFDLRATCNIASNTEEQLEIVERDCVKIHQDIEQLRLDLENTSVAGSLNLPGRLVWRIGDFAGKLKLAKETGCHFNSPVLWTHHYGYKIRLCLYPNGLKKWRDRYALITMDVLEGEYDLLQKWPCCIEGTVRLRDLDNLEQPKCLTKSIVARKDSPQDENEEPQESSAQFIFIPHSALLKDKFLKNGTIFLDFSVDHFKL